MNVVEKMLKVSSEVAAFSLRVRRSRITMPVFLCDKHLRLRWLTAADQKRLGLHVCLSGRQVLTL